ncbi:MAG: ABC transporter substrate-binding protein, partial [Oscillospiraceae bacterium]|nr:ABC transporter substrate-binding protein [Oscillospiraceae bacterium]
MKTLKRSLALLLALVMVFALVACTGSETTTTKPGETGNNPATTGENKPSDTAAPTPDTSANPGPVNDTPLVVAYSAFSQKFSPFYADTAYDQDVAGFVGLGLMTTDRMGGIIYNAIEGETVNYNGTDYLYTGPADL